MKIKFAWKERAFWLKLGFPAALVVIALVTGFGIYQYQRAHDLRERMEQTYRRAFMELSDDVSGVRSELAKAMVISDRTEMVKRSSAIYRMADGAKEHLGYLPMPEEEMVNTEKFLSQVGDYCAVLAVEHLEGSPVTQEESAHMRDLYQYAKGLEESLGQMDLKLQRGEIALWDAGQQAGKTATVSGEWKSVEEDFQEYPSLIYDGPFSEHLLNRSPIALESLETVRAEDARNTVRELLGNRANVLTFREECEGRIPCYYYAGQGPDGRQLSAQVTKAGGKLLWFLDARQPYEIKIDMDTAKSSAQEFLHRARFGEVEESYYEIKGNIATINYAALQDGVILYPDLIKVRVAMDNGEVLGMESTGYYMNHQTRVFPEVTVSQEEAREKLSAAVVPEQCRAVLIPLESGKESLCYEWKVRMEEEAFLVYVNMNTGEVDDVLMLIESPEGTLTV